MQPWVGGCLRKIAMYYLVVYYNWSVGSKSKVYAYYCVLIFSKIFSQGN